MRVQLGLLIALLFNNWVFAEDTDKPWDIHGQVIDERGRPVEDFEASTFWLANGNWWDEKGELLKEAAAGKLWTNEGVMAPSPHDTVQRLPGGRFNLTVDDWPRQAIFAVDKRHEEGGIVLVERSASDRPIAIKLEPLVRVTGKVACSEAGKTPGWSNAVIYVPDAKGNLKKLMLCGSFHGDISFLLPPGKYDLDVYTTSPTGTLRPSNSQAGKNPNAGWTARVMPVDVPHGKTTLDLGVLEIQLRRDKEGNPRDLTQYYGKAPPELAITDARGVSKDFKLTDLRGKWVVLDFWEVGCSSCVERSLPELTKFCEEHSANRDRFEILAICNTEAEKAHTLAEYDTLAARLVEKVWGGKQLPYPVLIDGEGKTSGNYGIQFLPTVLLIDPEGHLVADASESNVIEKLEAGIH